MNTNSQYTLVFIFAFVFSILFVNASSTVQLDVNQVVPELIKVNKTDAKKFTVEVGWSGIGKSVDKERGITILRCEPSKAVTVENSHQHHAFGDLGTTYKLDVHKENVLVNCKSRIFDIENFATFSFRT